jgi:hypothetical protein
MKSAAVRLRAYSRRLAVLVGIGLLAAVISMGAAHGAPSLDNLTTDSLITFQTAGQDQAHDIVVADNKGGLRFYGCPILTVIPDCAAIQFFGNQSSGFPGQLFLDTGAHNSGAIIFRSAGTGGTVAERMRVTSGGNVGIGTNAPGERLTVKGSERILGESNPAFKGSITNATTLDSAAGVFVSGGTPMSQSLAPTGSMSWMWQTRQDPSSPDLPSTVQS